MSFAYLTQAGAKKKKKNLRAPCKATIKHSQLQHNKVHKLLQNVGAMILRHHVAGFFFHICIIGLLKSAIKCKFLQLHLFRFAQREVIVTSIIT
jgi:hypothetical protein